ncbi:hypothetical protein ACFL6I_20135 [candidate division KSB1 bacterium]
MLQIFLRSILFSLVLLFAVNGNTQNIAVEEIKSSGIYLWGEGKDTDRRMADKLALEDLISQISVQVESNFSNMIVEENGDLKEYTKTVVNTYSSTMLNQAQRKEINDNEGNTLVIRYIKKEDVSKVFNNRKNSIFDYTAAGIYAEKELRIADALRNFYWALALLNSHPDYKTIKYNFHEYGELALHVALPEQINRIFSRVDINHMKSITSEDQQTKTIILDIKYLDQPVQNFDYTYYTGDTWSGHISGKNGKGPIKLYGEAAKSLSRIRLIAEYTYEQKSHYDLELMKVLETTRIPKFKGAEYKIPISEENTEMKSQKIEEVYETLQSEPLNEVNDYAEYEDVMKTVINGIIKKSISPIRNNFTDDGYLMYQQLIGNGKVLVLDVDDTMRFIQLNDEIIARSVPMLFSYPNNNKKFLENVVFTFNKDKKVDAISFALSDKAIDDIEQHSERWGSIEDKYQLIKFMEYYKTAYCLKRIDYLESIFDENALIIVGHILKKSKPLDGMYGNLGKNRIEYIRLSKQEYMERLRRVFRSNEFVNIDFEDNTVLKRNADEKVYGIQIAQHYYSSNYSDFGYLFLMIDLNDSLNPRIYVRTWQPEKNTDGSIFGLSDFHF